MDWASTGSGEAAAGRRCWEILDCRSASCRHCDAIRLLPAQQETDDATFAPPAVGYPPDRCLVFPLSQPAKGLLIWGPQGRAAPTPWSMLRFLSNQVGAILSSDLVSGAETMLELIRIATQADDCELFLADLYGKEMLLTACVGADRALLLRHGRFEAGNGFPGLALATARPVTSPGIAPGDRLPEKETPQAKLAFISVPIPAPDGRVIGCLNLGWRRPEVPIQAIADALWATMSPVGSAICAAYWTYGQNIVQATAPGAAPSAAGSLRALVEAVGGSAGSLVMWDETNRQVQRSEVFGPTPPICPWLASPDAAPCASRTNASCFRLLAVGQPDAGTPGPCRQVQFDGTSVCCIPIVGHPTRTGRLLVGFRERLPEHAGRLLVPLQIMAEHLGMHLPERSAAPQVSGQELLLPLLDIRCFGHFELAIGDQKLAPASFPRRDALTLLKILVLRAGKQLHRQQLIDWLWPETDERSGLNRLHGVVHSLRGVIEPQAAERRWIYLLNEGENYCFVARNTVSVDLISFQDNLALARREARDGPFAPNATYYLEQAVALYRGDLYEDDQYRGWCDVERITLQREFIEALARLARIYLTHGEARRAIETLRRALVSDPSREDLHGELIRCLMGLRRYNEAKDQVRQCIRYLREEVGVEPSSETQHLYHALSRPHEAEGTR